MKYIESIYTPGMSGKIGNTIYSRNHYGPYSCERKIPVYHNTPAQQNVKAGTAAIARMWVELTQIQRNDWNRVATYYPFQKKGKIYFLTGFAFFMKLNRNLYEVGEPLLTDPPEQKNSAPQSFSLFSVQMVNTPSGKDLLLFLNPAIRNNTKIKLFATMPLKTSEQYGTHKTFKIAVFDSTFISGSSIKDLYINKYKQYLGLRSKAFFDMRSTNISSGITTNPVTSEVYGI